MAAGDHAGSGPPGRVHARHGGAAACPVSRPGARQAQRAGRQRQHAAQGRRAAADQRDVRKAGQLRRRRAAGLHAMRRLLLRLQRRLQEHRAGDVSRRRLPPRRRDLHRDARIARAPGAWALARLLRAARPRAREVRRRRSVDHLRRRRARRRNARLDRDPAALARGRAAGFRSSSASASPATAMSSPSPTTTTCRSTASASASRPSPRRVRWGRASPGSSICATRPSSRTAW